MIHRLTIICFIVILVEVLSQGGGGGGGSKGGGIPFIGCIHWNFSSTIACIKHELIGFLIAGIIVVIVLCIGCCVAISNYPKTDPNRLNKADVKKAEQTENELTIPININNIFESGQWSSRYHQYTRWHGPLQQEITFNIDQNTLSGNGIDDIGEFTLTGNISTELLTINMIKNYRLNTGNAKENFGHEVKMDLKWNNEKHAFEGQWSLHTSKYQGEGPYELIKVKQSLESKEQDSPV